jgi:hypothetical protein
MPETKALHDWMQSVLTQLITLSKDIESIRQQLAAHQNSVTSDFQTLETNLSKRIHNIEVLLTGNGNPSDGLIVRTDRLEQDGKRQKWMVKTIGAALIGSILTLIFDLFGGKK